MIHPQRICAFTAAEVCGNRSIELFGESRELPFFEVINDQNWHPRGWGYNRASYVWGMEVNYIPTGQQEQVWNFRLRKGRRSSIELSIVSANRSVAERIAYDYHTQSFSLRAGENFEEAGVAVRRIGMSNVIYLGVGFQTGSSDWMDGYGANIIFQKQ